MLPKERSYQAGLTSPISAEAGERGREGSKEKNRTRLHLTELVIGLRLVCQDMIRSSLSEPADFEDMLNRAELGVVGQDDGVKPVGGRDD